MMKALLSKLTAIILLFNLISPLSAFADNEIAVFNCGKPVNLSMGLTEFSGRKYLHEKDLDSLNLKLRSNVISDYEDEVHMRFYPGSSIVTVNDITINYPNSAYESESYSYISLDLIAMVFSKIYEVTDTKINLWISRNQFDFAKGYISLPFGEVAPEGGITAEVFAARLPAGGSSGGGSSSGGTLYDFEFGNPGFDKSEEKPMYGTTTNKKSEFLDYGRVISKTVTIPEGKNGVEYTLSADADSFYRRIIGCYAEINGKRAYGRKSYINSGEVYNFTLSPEPTINGTIEIPTTAENDVAFKVIAHGYGDFVCDGIIPSGKTSAVYSVEVDKDASYSLEVIFLDGEYLRMYSQNDIAVGTEEINNINFTVQAANEYKVKASLPDGYEIADGKDVTLTMFLQTASSPYYILDSESLSLDGSKRNSEVVLHDDMASKSVICYYVLSDDYKGLFNYGHYSKSGTTFDINNADRLNIKNSEIDITLLRSKEISVNFSLPDTDAAEKNIEISINPIVVTYPLNSGNMEVVAPIKSDKDGDDVINTGDIITEDGTVTVFTDSNDSITITPENLSEIPEIDPDKIEGVSSLPYSEDVAPPTIAKGERTGQKTLTVPDEDGYEYILRADISGGADKYYGKIYYNREKSTAVQNRATPINKEDSNIDIELIGQHCITGYVNAVGFKKSVNRITAAAKTTDSVIEDIGDCEFSAYTEIFGTAEYRLYVPSEFEKYVLSLTSLSTDGTVYYAPDECTDSISKAAAVTVTEDVNNIDFRYNGYNPPMPLAMSVTRMSGNSRSLNVKLTNIGDFDTDDVDLYIGLYDDKGALTNLLKENVNPVKARSSIDVPINIPMDYINNDSIKIMAWDDMSPLADFIHLNCTYIAESKIASLFIQAENADMYVHGEPVLSRVLPRMYNGALYAPVRNVAEILGWSVCWNMDTQELTINSGDDCMILAADEFKARINEKTVALNNALAVIDDNLMLPVVDVLPHLGYECIQNDELETVAVYDAVDIRVRYAADNGLLPSELLGGNITDFLTRSELAALVVKTYETTKHEDIEITQNPFDDCDDKNVLKACSLGIMSKESNNLFAPGLLVTREEYSKAVYLLLSELGLYIPYKTEYSDSFSDVADSHWASGYINGLKEIGIFDDVYEKYFEIGASITRREALAIIGNGHAKLTIPMFADIPEAYPYSLAITNLSGRGLMFGYEDGTFRPYNTVMRSEFACLIARMNGVNEQYGTAFTCDDVQSSHWASGYIGYCIKNGIMQTENNKFRPDDSITSGEVADALVNQLGISKELPSADRFAEACKMGILNRIHETVVMDQSCNRGLTAQLIENVLNAKGES